MEKVLNSFCFFLVIASLVLLVISFVKTRNRNRKNKFK